MQDPFLLAQEQRRSPDAKLLPADVLRPGQLVVPQQQMSGPGKGPHMLFYRNT